MTRNETSVGPVNTPNPTEARGGIGGSSRQDPEEGIPGLEQRADSINLSVIGEGDEEFVEKIDYTAA